MLGTKPMIFLMAMIAILAVVGLAILAKSSLYPQQQIQAQHQPRDQHSASSPETNEDQNQQANGGAAVQEPKNYRERFVTFIERREKFITATSTIFIAAFTVVLAIATGFLYFVTKNLVSGAEETAQRQLRAYVAVFPLRLDYIKPNEPLVFTTGNVNGGQTPAYKLTTSGTMLLLDRTLPPNFPFPVISEEPTSRTTLPPRLQFDGHIRREDITFSQEQLIEILTAEKRQLYFFGQVDYIDAFGKSRWTRFCFSLPGFLPAIQLAKEGKWNEIEKIITSPGFSFTFNVCNQHNVTDDG